MDIIFSAGLPLIFYILSFLRADELMSKRKYDKDQRLLSKRSQYSALSGYFS